MSIADPRDSITVRLNASARRKDAAVDSIREHESPSIESAGKGDHRSNKAFINCSPVY